MWILGGILGLLQRRLGEQNEECTVFSNNGEYEITPSVKTNVLEYAREEEQEAQKMITLTHTRTLKLANDVLAIKFSPNNTYLAVATLDSTVQIFYQDSLKFYLSLYGHKVTVWLYSCCYTDELSNSYLFFRWIFHMIPSYS